MNQPNQHKMGIPEGKKGKKCAKRIFQEIITENLADLVKDTNLHIQET